MVEIKNLTFNGFYVATGTEGPTHQYMTMGYKDTDDVEYMLVGPTQAEYDGSRNLSCNYHFDTREVLEGLGVTFEPYSPGPTPIPTDELKFTYDKATNSVNIIENGTSTTYRLDRIDNILGCIIRALCELTNPTDPNFGFSYNEDTDYLTLKDSDGTSMYRVNKDRLGQLYRDIIEAINDLKNTVTVDVYFEDITLNSSYSDKIIIGYEN